MTSEWPAEGRTHNRNIDRYLSYEDPLILAAACDDSWIYVSYDSGQTIRLPIRYSRRLEAATGEQRRNIVIDAGVGLHWPDIDEDLSGARMLRDWLTGDWKPCGKLLAEMKGPRP